MQKAFTSQNWYWGKTWHDIVQCRFRYTWSLYCPHIVRRGVLLLTKWARQGNHARCIVLPKALWHMQAFCRDFSGTENHVLICDRPLYTAVAFVWKLFIQQQNASYAIFWSEQHLCWKIIYSPLFWEKTNQIIVLLYHHCISIKKSLFHFMCFIQWSMVKGPSESQFI